MGPGFKRIGLFCILVALFFGGALSVPGILERFSRKLPENYRLIATEAINRGDYSRALQITERRINQFAYDFDALNIRAEALARMGRPAEAADTMKEAMRRVPAARSSKIKAVGYDEAKTLLLTSRYLWQAGLFAEAAEMILRIDDMIASAGIKEPEGMEGMPPGMGGMGGMPPMM